MPSEPHHVCSAGEPLPHPARNASLETIWSYHHALKQDLGRWRVCRLLRIEPTGHTFREIRTCPGCSNELSRPVRLVRLTYFEDLFIPAGFTMDQLRREALMTALRATNGRMPDAAEMLGISRRTAYNWVVEFNLSVESPGG